MGKRSHRRGPTPATRAERAAKFLESIKPGAFTIVERRPSPPAPARASKRQRTLLDLVDPTLLPRGWPVPAPATLRTAVEHPAPPAPRPAAGFIASPVDRDGIYSRQRRAGGVPTINYEDLNRGRWSDLDPDDFGPAPGHGAGDVRAYLAHVGIQIEEWEGMPHESRVALREALRDLLVVERAVGACFDTVDPHLAKTALNFLKTMAGHARRNRNSPRGFERGVQQRNRWAWARWMYVDLVYVLGLVKRHFRRALTDSDGAGRANLAAQVNVLLQGQYGPDARRCSPEHIERLLAEDAGNVAKDIMIEIDAALDLDAVDRALPRHRNRKTRRTPGQ